FFSSRRRHTRSDRDWSSDVCSSDLNRKAELLANTVEHVAIDQYDARPIIDAMRQMSFTSRDTARAADIWSMSLEDADCSTWLTLAGSTSAGGCMHIYRDMLKYRSEERRVGKEGRCR